MDIITLPKDTDTKPIREGVYKDGEFQILDSSF